MENSKVIISLEHQFGFVQSKTAQFVQTTSAQIVQTTTGQMQQQLDEFCDLFLNKD